MNTTQTIFDRLRKGERLPSSVQTYYAPANEVITSPSGSDNARSVKVHIKALGKGVIQHPVFGPVVHDFSTVRIPKKLAIDDTHGLEVGKATPMVTEYGLEVDGFVVPKSDRDAEGNLVEDKDHPSSRIAYNLREGFPQAASADWRGPFDVELIPEGATAQVNGLDVAGPCLKIMNWGVRSVAICKVGVDPSAMSEAQLNSAGQELAPLPGKFTVAGEKPVVKEPSAQLSSEPKNVTCSGCQNCFEYAAQPEVSSGCVACPQCHAHVNQQGQVQTPAPQPQENTMSTAVAKPEENAVQPAAAEPVAPAAVVPAATNVEPPAPAQELALAGAEKEGVVAACNEAVTACAALATAIRPVNPDLAEDAAEAADHFKSAVASVGGDQTNQDSLTWTAYMSGKCLLSDCAAVDTTEAKAAVVSVTKAVTLLQESYGSGICCYSVSHQFTPKSKQTKAPPVAPVVEAKPAVEAAAPAAVEAGKVDPAAQLNSAKPAEGAPTPVEAKPATTPETKVDQQTTAMPPELAKQYADLGLDPTAGVAGVLQQYAASKAEIATLNERIKTLAGGAAPVEATITAATQQYSSWAEAFAAFKSAHPDMPDHQQYAAARKLYPSLVNLEPKQVIRQ